MFTFWTIPSYSLKKNMNSAAGILWNMLQLQVSLFLSAVVELLQGNASKVAELETRMQLLGFNIVEDTLLNQYLHGYFYSFSDLISSSILVHKYANHECINCREETRKWKVNKPFLCSLALKCHCKKMFCDQKWLKFHIWLNFFFFFLRMFCTLCATLLEKFSALLYSRGMEYKPWLNILFEWNFFFL